MFLIAYANSISLCINGLINVHLFPACIDFLRSLDPLFRWSLQLIGGKFLFYAVVGILTFISQINDCHPEKSIDSGF